MTVGSDCRRIPLRSRATKTPAITGRSLGKACLLLDDRGEDQAPGTASARGRSCARLHPALGEHGVHAVVGQPQDLKIAGAGREPVGIRKEQPFGRLRRRGRLRAMTSASLLPVSVACTLRMLPRAPAESQRTSRLRPRSAAPAPLDPRRACVMTCAALARGGDFVVAGLDPRVRPCSRRYSSVSRALRNAPCLCSRPSTPRALMPAATCTRRACWRRARRHERTGQPQHRQRTAAAPSASRAATRQDEALKHRGCFEQRLQELLQAARHRARGQVRPSSVRTGQMPMRALVRKISCAASRSARHSARSSMGRCAWAASRITTRRMTPRRRTGPGAGSPLRCHAPGTRWSSCLRSAARSY